MAIRPLGLLIGGAPWADVMGDPVGRFRDFVLGPNFDSADVWPVAVEYTRLQGLLLGQTLLAAPARLATPGFRFDTGMLTAVDRLNEFYWGDHYWMTNFGFNVNLAQEAYINFGWASTLFGFIVGLLTAHVDRRIWSLVRYDTSVVYLVSGLFVTGGFTGELAGALQWIAAYLGLGVLVSVLSKIAWSPEMRRVWKDGRGSPRPTLGSSG